MGAERTRWEWFPFRGIERLFGCAQTLLDKTAAIGYPCVVREGDPMTPDDIARAVGGVDFGTASASKRGSNADYPYVPIIKRSDTPLGTTINLTRRLAFATREEAVACAQRQIDACRSGLARDLATPRYRALREHYGLPRELTDGAAEGTLGM